MMDAWHRHGIPPCPGAATVTPAPIQKVKKETQKEKEARESNAKLESLHGAVDLRTGVAAAAAAPGEEDLCQDSISSIRDKLSKAALEIFTEDMKGIGDDAIPLPREGLEDISPGDGRRALLEAQKADSYYGKIILQFQYKADPETFTGTGKLPDPLSPEQLKEFRLHSVDEILEKQVALASSMIWVPVAPDVRMPWSEKGVT